MSEFEPGDRSVNDLWTAFMEWLWSQGDVEDAQTTYESDRKFAGLFDVADQIVLLTWVVIPRAGSADKVVLDPYVDEVELDRRAGIVDKWEEEP